MSAPAIPTHADAEAGLRRYEQQVTDAGWYDRPGDRPPISMGIYTADGVRDVPMLFPRLGGHPPLLLAVLAARPVAELRGALLGVDHRTAHVQGLAVAVEARRWQGTLGELAIVRVNNAAGEDIRLTFLARPGQPVIALGRVRNPDTVTVVDIRDPHWQVDLTMLAKIGVVARKLAAGNPADQ